MGYTGKANKAWSAHTPKSGSTLLKEMALVAGCVLAIVGVVAYKDRIFGRSKQVIPAQEMSVRAAGAPNIRVAVLKDAPSVRISSGVGEARVVTATGQEVLRLRTNSTIQISIAPNGMVVDGSQLINTTNLVVENTAAGQPLRINDQEVAPRLTVFRFYDAPAAGAQNAHKPEFSIKPGCLTVVAHLNLEEYLVGVLSGEVPVERWHPEALKAQAIASRSYAFYELKKNAADPYDVENTVMSQVFRSGSKSNPVVDSVLIATRGLAVTENGTLFPAYFHSTCGGRTERSPSVFPDRPFFGPLAGTTCAFCAQSPSYRWHSVLNKTVLEQRLKAAYGPGQPIGRINSVEFFDSTGALIGPVPGQVRRATQVRVHHSRGVLQIQGNNFRLMAGPKELKSLAFEQIVDNGVGIEFSGGGFGHGVGLCQYGSQGMAQAGNTYAQILGMYYPGGSLTKMY